MHTFYITSGFTHVEELTSQKATTMGGVGWGGWGEVGVVGHNQLHIS